MKYRGKGAADALRRRCAGGAPFVAFPANASASHLCAVNIYKHLGFYVSINSSLGADASHRGSLAMSAYAPVAVRVFGARCVSTIVE